MKTIAVGYYERNNFGDDMFQELMPKVFSGSVDPSKRPLDACHKNELEFRNIDELVNINLDQYPAIIVGGGDVFVDYFINHLKLYLKDYKGVVLGYNVGIPFDDLLIPANTRLFDAMFVRSKQHLSKLQLLLGSDRVHYLPDLGFSLYNETKFKSPEPDLLARGKKVGIFLAQDLSRYGLILDTLAKWLEKLSFYYDLYLFAYDTNLIKGTSTPNINQNDTIINGIIKHRIPSCTIVNTTKLSLDEMLHQMSQMDYGVCSRYHSAILCTVLGIPFITISGAPKIWNYMEESDLGMLSIKTKMDKDWKPCEIDMKEIEKKFSYIVTNYTEVNTKLHEISKFNHFLLDTDQPNVILQNLTKNTRIVPKELDINQHHILSCLTRDETPEITAKKMCHMLTGDACSEYLHGTIENITNKGFDAIPGMIKWVVKDITNKFTEVTRVNTQFMKQSGLEGIHRSGWRYVANQFKQLHEDGGILLDLYLDKSFGWNCKFMREQGIIPYNAPWMCFVHHTHNTEYSIDNNVNLIKTKEFRQSLPMCRAIYVLSLYLKNWWREQLDKLGYPDIPVHALIHPTEFNFKPFNDIFTKLGSYSIVSVGAWLRDPISINLLNVKVPKFALKGKMMDNYFPPKDLVITRDMLLAVLNNQNSDTRSLASPPDVISRIIGDLNMWVHFLIKYLIKWLSMINVHHLLTAPDVGDDILDISKTSYTNKIQNALLSHVKGLISSVKVLDMLDNDAYDTLLASNVVYLKYVDISASNTLVEAIVRNTPVLVNPLPAVVQLLGENYPLYFSDETEVPKLLKKVGKAYRYLRKLDKDKYRGEYFLESFRKTLEV